MPKNVCEVFILISVQLSVHHILLYVNGDCEGTKLQIWEVIWKKVAQRESWQNKPVGNKLALYLLQNILLPKPTPELSLVCSKDNLVLAKLYTYTYYIYITNSGKGFQTLMSKCKFKDIQPPWESIISKL